MRTPDLLKSITPLSLALAFLVACQSAATTGTVSMTSAPAPTPFPQTSVTPTNTPTVTPSASPRPAQVLSPTPSFENSHIADDFFFTPSLDAECHLPCWQGLRVSESWPEDVQRMFDTVFGFNGTVDFFDSSYLQHGNLPMVLEEIPGLYVTGYRWYFPEHGGEFHLALWMDIKTDLLEGIVMYWFASGDYEIHSVQKVIRTLGQPLAIFVSDPRSVIARGDSDKTYANLQVIYRDGMMFYFDTLSLSIKSEPGANQGFGELCLASSKPVMGNDRITRPFGSNVNSFTALQNAWAQCLVGCDRFVPIETVFDTTLEQITALVKREQDACIRTKP